MGVNSIAASGLGCRMAFVGTGHCSPPLHRKKSSVLVGLTVIPFSQAALAVIGQEL